MGSQSPRAKATGAAMETTGIINGRAGDMANLGSACLVCTRL